MQIATERLKLNPRDADALFALAAAQGTLDDARGGVQTLERLAQIDPYYPGLWILKAKLHAYLGESDKARESRVRAQEAEPSSGEPARTQFPCPICEAPVPTIARTCPNCGVKFQTTQTLEDELDALGHEAIQEMVQQDLGVAAKPEPKRPAPPPPKQGSKPVAQTGLTNGLILKRRGGPRAGMTNGLKGRTNGVRGRTNGLTNGVGRTNGLTNGVGRTNGLTNGVGRTNGLTNGLSRTNGLTNGLGRTNGITNGLGRTNGLTNGLGSGLSSAAFHASRRGGMRSAGWKLYLIPLVGVGLLVLPLFFVPEYTGPSYPIQIDGQFSDWTGVPRFPAAGSTANPNVDITRVAVMDNVDSLAFYIEVRGVALQGGPAPGRIVDAFYVFVDIDRSSATGYRIQGLGADRLVEIDGWSGRVTGAILFEFDANRDQRDWGGWFKATPISAAASGSQIEFEADWMAVAQSNGTIEAAFAARGWDGVQVVADTTATSARPFVRVRQQSAAPQLAVGTQSNLTDLTFEAVGGSIEVTALNVTLRGTFTASTLSSLALVDAGGNILSNVPVTGARVQLSGLSIQIPEGTTATLQVRPAVTLDDGTTVGAFVAAVGDVVTRSAGVVFQDPPGMPTSLAYVGIVPSTSRVDGGFAEWTNLTTDATADVLPVGSSDLDITRYAFQASSGDVYFVVQTAGTALNGTVVPAPNHVYLGAGGSPPDSDRDRVPDSEDPLPYDFNNDGTPDAATNGDYDGDGITDYGFAGGTDLWLNTTIPASFPAPYAGQSVRLFIGPVQRPIERGEDTGRFYLDHDGSAATGYAIGGIGADYLVEVGGKGTQILSSVAMRFNGTDPGEWSWTSLGPAAAANDRSRLEVVLSGVALTNASRAFITTRGWEGRTDEGGTIRPAFVGGLGLMYSTSYGSGVDPTGISDTSTASAATSGPHERNVFYDGTNFWAFYYDGTTVQYEPSADGLSWVNAKNTAFTTTNIRRVSTWFHDTGSTKIVYIVGDNNAGATVRARRGTISGTTITWGTEGQVTISGQSELKRPFISRDSSGYLWIASNNKEGGNAYTFAAVRSTNVDDVSAWDTYTDLPPSTSALNSIQGVILPLGSGEVYALWYKNGLIEGKKYSGTWGSLESIDGQATTGDLSIAPSATVDGSFNIHLVYVDEATGAVKYRQRTSSWGAATTLDSSSGNTYATISRDTATGDLYCFWIASDNQLKSQKYSGSWSSVTLETNTKAKSLLNSVYNVSSSSNIAWAWSQGSVSPYDVKFSVLSSSVQSRTIDTSTDSSPLSYNHQRKIFFDGAYYWAIYFDGSNSVYTYSSDALTWENTVSQAFTTAGVDNPSVWFHDTGSTKIVYIVGDEGTNDNQAYARRGTMSGTTISWGTQATLQVSITNNPSKITFITRDSNGFLWIASNSKPTASTYNVGVVKSTNADDVSAWGSVTNIMDSSVSNDFVYPTILPLSGGSMYALWYADGSVAGKKYTGTWETQETLDTTTAGVATKIPSAVADSSDNIHLVYIASSGAVLYRQRTSSWASPTTLDSASGSSSPTITANTVNNNLYAFWIDSTSQIKGKQYAGSWTDITLIDTSTITKGFLTSPYSYSSESLTFVWGQGGSSPYEIKIQYIPEFQELLPPIGVTAVLVVALAGRRRNCTVEGRLTPPVGV